MASATLEKRDARSRSAPRVASAADLRQVAVLSKDDFARIQYLLKKQQLEKQEQEQAAQEKEAIRERSKQLVENWDNTLKRKYQRKLEARDKRLAEQEEERKKLDVEELKIQAEKRKKALDEAKKKQYFQTDRIKSFHSAFLLTEVLREREAQIELRRLKGSNANNMDAYLNEIWERENEAAIVKERENAAKRIREARQNAQDIKAQIKQHLHEKNLKESEKLKETEEVERLRLQFMLEKERLKQIELEEKRLLHDDYMQQIDDVHKMREIDRLRNEEEEEECRVFAAAKRKMMQMRAQREAELSSEKQAELNRIKDKLAAQLSALKNDEQERLERAVAEAEEKFQKDEQNKRESRENMLREMNSFRKAKEGQISKERAEEQARDAEMLRMRLEADRLFKLNEFEKRRRNRQEAQHVSDYQLRQAATIKDRANNVKEADLREAKLQEKVLDLEEEQFQKYVTTVIDDAKKIGKNVYPLEQAARPRPGFSGLGPQLPGRTNYLTDDQLAEVNQLSETISSKREAATQDKLKKTEKERKRLGMVW